MLLIEELLVRVLRFLPSTGVYRTTIVCTAWNAAADQCPLAWSSVWPWGHPTLPSPANHITTAFHKGSESPVRSYPFESNPMKFLIAHQKLLLDGMAACNPKPCDPVKKNRK